MFINICVALLLYGALLLFYRWNEPKARARELKHGPNCPYFQIPQRRQ